MHKNELFELLACKDRTAGELRSHEPALWDRLVAAEHEIIQARVEDWLEVVPASVRERLAGLDLADVPAQDVLGRIRDALAQDNAAPDAVEAPLASLESATAGLLLSTEEHRRIAEIPALGPYLDRARLYQVAGMAGLGDDVAEVIAEDVHAARELSDRALHRLVQAETLSEEQAGALGLVAAIYQIADEDAVLAAAIRGATPARLGGRAAASCEELAALTAAEWDEILAGADVPNSEGSTRPALARGLAERFATLCPEAAFVGRLPAARVDTLGLDLEAMAPVLAKTADATAASLEELAQRGLAPAELAGVTASHERLHGLVRAYPGLQLAGLFDDSQRAAADRAAVAARRIGLVERACSRLRPGELFALDLAPGSAGRTQLDASLSDATADEKAMVRATLAAYQRSYALARHVDDAHGLLACGFASARDIARQSLSALRDATGLDEARARRIRGDARAVLADSAATLASVLDAGSGLFDGMDASNLQSDVLDHLRQLDGYEALLGSLSFCHCEHCESLLGPAAYFVDLMAFVDEHIRPALADRAEHPLDLRTRRPDLWTLELGCASTNDPVPTLEVVAEILENEVARRHGYDGPLGDRAAIHDVVYAALANATSSFHQPFHLPLARVHAYLGTLGRTRAEITRAVGAGAETVATAELGLSPAEWQILIQPVSDLEQLNRLYGTSFAPAGSELEPVDVHALLAPMGLGRGEFGELVITRFVAAGGATVTIEAGKRDEDSVQNDVERVHGLTVNALDRMHRFTRLSRALPWSMAELDLVLATLGAATLAAPDVRAVAALRRVEAQLDTTLEETCALAGDIPRTPEGASLFDRLFNAPSAVAAHGALPSDTQRFVHPAFRHDTEAPADPALPRLLAGLGVDLDGLAALARHLAPHLDTEQGRGFDPAAPDEDERGFVLSAANLTLLYRHARLAQALSLSMDALFQLVSLSGLGGPITGLADTTALLDLHAWWKGSGLTLDDLAVATGMDPRDPARYLDPDAIALEIAARAGDALVFRDTIFAVALGTTEQGSRDLLAKNLALVEPVGGGQWRLVAGADLAETPIVIPDSATVPLPSGDTRLVTIDEVRGALAVHHPAEALARILAEAFGVAASKLRALVALADRSLDTEALGKVASGEEPAAALRDLIAALQPLAVAFRASAWDAEALDFVRAHPDAFGLALPALTIAGLRHLSVHERLARRTAGADASAGAAAAAQPAGAADPTADLRAALAAFDAQAQRFPATADAALARALGVSQGLIVGLRDRVALSPVAAQALETLHGAARLAHELKLDGEALAALASEDHATLARATEALLAAIRGRYPDQAERTRHIERAEEPLRERRRDALVAYMLHSIEAGPFATASDLHAHFLMDVHAGGCATTSRVAAAIASVQLYVHRVRMGLEQDRRDPADPLHVHLRLPGIAATEWTWRKNYRVWEANRKVFLWPENYLEPDLRDDRTPLFQELEAELLQTDLRDQDVLDAYARYLKGFEELASLTVAGAYHDVRTDGERTVDVLHLFGVSAADPPVFYHRTCENLRASGQDPTRAAVWSPWRPLDVQIASRCVSPVVFQDQLHVFWTDYKTRPTQRLASGASQFDGYLHTMSLRSTTLRADGTWTAPQTVELPRGNHFGAARGSIPDVLDPNGKPRLDTQSHDGPIDDYTLRGPTWDWTWPEPGTFGGQPVLDLRYRNGLAHGAVNLYGRRVEDHWHPWAIWPQPDLLCARNTALYIGSPASWYSLFAGWGANAMANLVIEESRLDMLERELSGSKLPLQDGLYAERIATLRPRSRLLAVPGSVEDGIAQIGSDIVLLQGSATEDDTYLARRIGTTLAPEVTRRLFTAGLDGLLDIETQKALREAGLPLTLVGDRIEDRSNHGTLDFRGAYGGYYREIFFHIPYLLASALSARGRFAAAQRWYHAIFDPTATEVIEVPPGASPEQRERLLRDRVWRYLELRGLDAARLRDILTDESALAAHRADPFNPHAIARLRPSSYQKAVVMKYVNNLLDWGDHLFTQFTAESVNEAFMLYTMAADILGPRPAQLGPCGDEAGPRTYESLAASPDSGEPLMLALESWSLCKRMEARRPAISEQPRLGSERTRMLRARARSPLTPQRHEANIAAPTGAEMPGGPVRLARANRGPVFRGLAFKTARGRGFGPQLHASTTNDGEHALAPVHHHDGQLDGADEASAFGWSILRQLGPGFCVPVNRDLLGFWDRVEDRLYKIRHCMDIQGHKRQLALFAPEIDPRLLAQMRAAGLTLEDVLGATSGNLPPYRFLHLIDRAKAFAASLSGFGAALLSALERKDAEEMARLRLVQQQNMARLTTQLRRWDLDVARESLSALERQRDAARYRLDFHQGLMSRDLTAWEHAQQVARHVASVGYVAEVVFWAFVGVSALAPQIGSPLAMKYGGVELSSSGTGWAEKARAVAQIAESVSASAGLEASFARRRESWQHQRELARRDIAQIERQIEAARIRVQIAARALALHEKGIEQLDEVLELMDGKLTSLGLYTWLATRLRRLYRDAYQNALSLARLAEQAFRFERGDDTSPGLAASYWDATRHGLLAGDQLLLDLQTLERRFLETHHRTLEVDQPFALSQIAPDALIQLRETGACRFTIPELFFDLAYPGHYKRRIKAVRVTIPCITGPYVNVSATLSLEQSWLRAQPEPSALLTEVPPRRSVSVATSTAQSDAGVFELSFRDERYMPFEGAGAISQWQLSLPRTFRSFDYQTVSDVVLSISYTAEHDGVLRERVEADNAALEGSLLHHLASNPLPRVLSLRHDVSGAFGRLLHSPAGTPVSFELPDAHIPVILRGRALQITRGVLLLRTAHAPAGLQLSIDGEPLASFAPDPDLGHLPACTLPASFAASGHHTLTVDQAGDLAAPGDAAGLDAGALQDILLYLEYRLA